MGEAGNGKGGAEGRGLRGKVVIIITLCVLEDKPWKPIEVSSSPAPVNTVTSTNLGVDSSAFCNDEQCIMYTVHLRISLLCLEWE